MSSKIPGFLILFFASSIFLSSCGPDDCQKLEAQVRKMVEDQTIDQEEWSLLTTTIQEGSKLYERAGCSFPDEAAIREFVTAAANKRKRGEEAVTIKFLNQKDPNPRSEKPLHFSFYLESSGSMFPYAKGNSEFRSAIYDLLTRLPDDSPVDNKMFYISNGAFEINGGVREFIKTRDPYEIVRNNPNIKSGSTDLTEIFRILLEESDKGGISILVSDCIYSVKNRDASADLVQLEFLTKDIFQNVANTHSVLVLQMSSAYDGIYYDYLNGKHPYNGQRPYYMVILGQNEKISAMLNAPQYRDLAQFSSLKGFQNFALFSPAKEIELPHYSMLSSTGKTGDFRPDRDLTDGSSLKGIIEADPRKRNGESNFEFSAVMDLNPIYADADYLSDPANYTVSASDDFKILSIEALSPTALKPTDKRYQESATHIISFHSEKISVQEQTLELKLKREKASWFEDLGIDDDLKFGENPSLNNKTFGLSYWVNGIQRAYQPVGAPDFFTISFSIKK